MGIAPDESGITSPQSRGLVIPFFVRIANGHKLLRHYASPCGCLVRPADTLQTS